MHSLMHCIGKLSLHQIIFFLFSLFLSHAHPLVSYNYNILTNTGPGELPIQQEGCFLCIRCLLFISTTFCE